MNSAVFEEFGDPDRSPLSRALARVAHTLPYVLALYLAYRALNWFEIINPNVWVAAFAAGVPLALVATASFGHIEIGRLCITCMQNVPADAPVRVKRWLPLLWLSHRLRGWKLLFAMFSLGLLGGVVAGLADFAPGSASWLTIPADLLLIAVLWGEWKHHRYRPWCPWCKDWGGGGMREPSPDPVGDGTKVA